MTEQVDPRGSVHTYAYDDLGRVVSTTDAEGGSWTFASSSGPGFKQVTMTTELGRVTTYRQEFANNGENRYVVTFPDGTSNTSSVRADGVATNTMADGSVITRSVKSHPLYGADSPIVETTTSARGSLIGSGTIIQTETQNTAITAPSGLLSISAITETSLENGTYQTTRAYNAATRTWTIASPAGRMKTVVLDALGRVSSTATAGTLPTLFEYDDSGRIEFITQGGRIASYEYDALSGFIDSYTDPESNTTLYATDDVGRVTQVENAAGDITEYGYDDESNIISITPPERGLHELSYSGVDLYDGYLAPEEGSVPRATVLTYDEDRSLVELEQPDGTSLGYSYGINGKLEQALIPDAGTFTYGYNAGGQLRSITTTGGFGDMFIEYAPRTTSGVPSTTPGRFPLLITTAGQIATGTSTASLGGLVEYTYSTRFLPLTVQPRAATGNAHGNFVTFSWDADKLLNSIVPTSPSPTLTFTRSTLDGHVTGTSIGVVTTTYDMDVSSGSPGTGDLEGMSASASSSPVFAATYVRDSLGRIERLDETVQGTPITRKYEYDDAGRLIAVLDGSDAVVSEYEYDRNGARVRALTPSGEVLLETDLGCGVGLTTPVDAQDRLCRYGNYEYGYDDNGRLQTKTNISTSGVTQYAYDGLGQLRRVTLPNTTVIDYAHDAQGRRVGKAVNNVLQRGWRYGVNSLQPLAQLNALGVIEKTFVYGTRVNVPELIIDRVGGATYRVIVDHLGSVRLVMNVSTGSVVQRMAYDEFGNVLADTNPGFQPFGFAGGLYDADTGLTRFGARDYDAATGRWTAKDPILFDGGTTNLYEYAGTDPINAKDPTGLADTLQDVNLKAKCKDGIIACTPALRECEARRCIKGTPPNEACQECVFEWNSCADRVCRPICSEAE